MMDSDFVNHTKISVRTLEKRFEALVKEVDMNRTCLKELAELIKERDKQHIELSRKLVVGSFVLHAIAFHCIVYGVPWK